VGDRTLTVETRADEVPATQPDDGDGPITPDWEWQ
jgi:hypothetical protein